jgi:phage-related protein
LILTIPATANITVRQRCGVTALDFSNYTERNSSAPLAEITIDFDALEQTQWDILRSQLDIARGVLPVQIPYVGNTRNFLVLEYTDTPVLYPDLAAVTMTAVEQRNTLLNFPTVVPTIKHPCWYDSNQTTTYKVNRQQYQSGFQSSIASGNVRTSITNWDVVFHLNRLEADTLDTTLMALRGVFPFYWQSLGSDIDTTRWLCDEWQTQYQAADFCIFTARFTNYDGRSPNYQTIWRS